MTVSVDAVVYYRLFLLKSCALDVVVVAVALVVVVVFVVVVVLI